MRRVIVVPLAAVAVLVAVLIAGCGSAQESEVLAAAGRFEAAVSAGDGGSACAALTERARRGVESFGRDCAQAVAGLPAAGRARTAEVWGDSAQVRFDGDVVFLALFEDGWRVRAAGCRPNPDGPYECTVEG